MIERIHKPNHYPSLELDVFVVNLVEGIFHHEVSPDVDGVLIHVVVHQAVVGDLVLSHNLLKNSCPKLEGNSIRNLNEQVQAYFFDEVFVRLIFQALLQVFLHYPEALFEQPNSFVSGVQILNHSLQVLADCFADVGLAKLLVFEDIVRNLVQYLTDYFDLVQAQKSSHTRLRSSI